MVSNNLVNRIIANKGRRVVLDANLLIPLILSNLIPDWRRHKTTEKFLPSDLDVIKGCLEYFGGMVTTPHILTEVCNHLDNTSALMEIKNFIQSAIEVSQSSSELSVDCLFPLYGLADVAITSLASGSADTILFSTEEVLVNHVISRGGNAISLTEAREMYREINPIFTSLELEN